MKATFFFCDVEMSIENIQICLFISFFCRLIVGAPKANYTKRPDHGNEIPDEPGIVYRCPLKESCVPVNVTNPDDEVGFIEQVQLNTLIEKGHGWFGAAISSNDETGLMTVSYYKML